MTSFDYIRFGILSPSQILSMSVCEVKYDKNKKISDLTNTLYDPRMGPVEDDIECPTCKMTMSECSGHFGHTILNEHIIHPLPFVFKMVVNFLKCFCFQCSRLVFSKDKLDLLNVMNYSGSKRYNSILAISDKAEICWNCGNQIAKFFVQNPRAEPKIMMFYKLLTEKKSKDSSIEVSVKEIERVFKSIIDEDIGLLGFNPSFMRPINLILSVVPILPPCSRPYAITNGERCEDDLTTILRDMLKANYRISTATDEESRREAVASLSFYLSVMMDNSKGRVKQPNGRSKKGLKERFSGKSGISRCNLLGKRTDYSARTVVGGDPTLCANQIGIPTCISTIVTMPEIVQKYNIDKLQQIVDSNQAEHVIRVDPETGKKQNIVMRIIRNGKTTPLFYGDKVFRKDTKDTEKEIKITSIQELRNGDRIVRSNGEEIYAEVNVPRKFHLKIGDEVHRHLQNGDWVVINRQPSLHTGSMLAGRVRIMPHGRTIRTPLNLTTPMNMDYDGKHCCQQ